MLYSNWDITDHKWQRRFGLKVTILSLGSVVCIDAMCYSIAMCSMHIHIFKHLIVDARLLCSVVQGGRSVTPEEPFTFVNFVDGTLGSCAV